MNKKCKQCKNEKGENENKEKNFIRAINKEWVDNRAMYKM